MNLIQSAWACNNKDLLQFNAGWYAPEYNLMSWALSCLQLKKYHSDVILYADNAYAKMLIDMLKLPYSEVIADLDKLNTINPKLWALPKIDAYSRQTEPFLHVDGDVYIWKPFSNQLLQSDLIAQNLEVSTDYYEGHMKTLEKNLSYFPPEIIEARKKYHPIYAYNAGILGGCDMAFFQEYTQKALTFIQKNESQLSKIDVSVFNIFFEQYLFYALVKKGNKSVAVLLNEIIGDNQYTGFSAFQEVPHHKQFLHLLGTFKRDRASCEQMANRLRLDYPEYYYRIISLFKKTDTTLKRDHYHFVSITSESFLLERLLDLKAGFEKSTLTLSDLSTGTTPTQFADDNLLEPILLKMQHAGQVKNEVYATQLKTDIKQFECKLTTLLKQKFIHYSKEYLYARDLNHTGYFQLIFADPKAGPGVKLIADPLMEVIECAYNWNEVYQSFFDEALIKPTLNLESSPVYTAVVPECDTQGYSLITIDELDLLLLNTLKEAHTLCELLNEVKSSFDPVDLENSSVEFEKLIHGRIKKAIHAKTVKAVI